MMSYPTITPRKAVHRLIPSRFPPVLLFDWVESQQELKEVAALENLTNDRIRNELGDITLVHPEDWVSGPGSTPLMAAFTHVGFPSRFTDGTYGVYYAAESIQTAISETKYHRERFLKASHEAPCLVQMREYKAKVKKPLINLYEMEAESFLNPDPNTYPTSQNFAKKCRQDKAWGVSYPSVRRLSGMCIAVFRPPALTCPIQGGHYDYIWNGKEIAEILKSEILPAELMS